MISPSAPFVNIDKFAVHLAFGAASSYPGEPATRRSHVSETRPVRFLFGSPFHLVSDCRHPTRSPERRPETDRSAASRHRRAVCYLRARVRLLPAPPPPISLLGRQTPPRLPYPASRIGLREPRACRANLPRDSRLPRPDD